MEVKKPLILVSNDDGYHAKGLRSLVAMLTDFADVVVCAPDAGRSGFAGAFSVAKPLLLKRRRMWRERQYGRVTERLWTV